MSNNADFPTGGYVTSVDVYLDTDWAGAHPDWRFDFSSAINRSSDGTHLRDFVFNVGTSPVGASAFVFNSSTNAFGVAASHPTPARALPQHRTAAARPS